MGKLEIEEGCKECCEVKDLYFEVGKKRKK
jgi:hypothetical protein